MSLDSMKEIFEHMEQEGKPFWEIVLEADMDDRKVSLEDRLRDGFMAAYRNRVGEDSPEHSQINA